MLSKSRSAQRRRLAALFSSIENLEQRRLLASTVNYSTGTYTQNFDTLANGTTTIGSAANPMDLSSSGYLVSGAPAGSMQGWNAAFAPAGTFNASSTTIRFSANDGSSGTGSLYSYGVANATNRALGTLASGSDVPEFGVELVNSGSTTISAFTVTYTGETFRIGESTQNTLYFGYEIGSSPTISDPDGAGGFTLVPSLYYSPAVQTTGNNAASSSPAGTPLASLTQTISQTIAGVSWAPGQTLILRWHDYNELGNDYGMAIDNFSFSQAVPIPGTVAFTSSGYSGQEATNSTINFVVQRSSGTLGTAVVDYAINGGTATQGVDYLAPTLNNGSAQTSGGYTGSFTFSGSQTTETISVPITAYGTAQNTKTFSITISKDSSDTSGFTLSSPATATGTIYGNDGTAPPGILLNELDVNPPGTDGPNEWVELINTSGSTQSLNNIYFTSIEGDVNSNAGNITYVYGFSGTLGAGQIALLEASTGGPTAPGGALVFQDSTANGLNLAIGALQNGTNTFALIYSQTPLTIGTDLDTNVNSSSTASNYPETSTLNQLTGSQALIDSVGWHDKTADSEGDGTIYGGADLSITGTIPDAATRIPGDNVANTASDWYYGELYSATGDPTSVTYNPSYVGGAFPAGGVLTPGGANYESAVTSGQIGFAHASYAVNEDISDSGTDDGSITLTINRVSGSTDAVNVNYAIVGGSGAGQATQGSDYGMPVVTSTGGSSGSGYSGTITFAAGQTSATIAIPIYNDSTPEPSEAFTVTLSNPQDPSNPSNAPLVGPVATTTVHIGDDDTKLLLTEILANVPGEAGDPTGNDQYNEFVELSGTPGFVVPANTYFVSVEGDSESTIGNITYVIDLGGTVVGSNGLIEIRSENAASLLPPPAPGTTVVNADNYDSQGDGFDMSGGALQNGTNSFLLISSANTLVNASTTTLTLGEDDNLDTTKSGTLDMTAIGGHLIDGVGWTDGGSGDVAYGALLNFGGYQVTQSLGSPAAEIAPAAGVRVPGTSDVPDLNPNSTASLTAASDWYYGSLIGQDTTAPATDDRLVFDPNYSARFNFNNQTLTSQDPNEHLTPGELNYNTAPFVELPTTAFAGGTVNPILHLDFSSNVSQNLTTSQMTLTNTDTSTTYSGISLASLTSAQAFANGYVETLNLPTNLPQGHYTLKINSGVTDDFGLQSTQSYTVHFTVIYGDANGDGTVNALDFNILATNFGSAGNYTQGDFDYSGMVGSNDFDILSNNYGKVIPAPSLSSPAAIAEALPSGNTPASSLAASSASLFSNQPISGSLAGDLLN